MIRDTHVKAPSFPVLAAYSIALQLCQIEYLRNRVGDMPTRSVNALVNEDTF